MAMDLTFFAIYLGGPAVLLVVLGIWAVRKPLLAVVPAPPDAARRDLAYRIRAIGYPVERYKMVAVMLSGLFAGLAGALYAVQNKFAAPDFVLFLISGETVIFNVMGGMGTLVGPVAGAAFFLLMKEVFSRVFYEYYLIPVGLIFTLMVIFLPQGLLGFLRRRLNQ